MSVYLGLRDAGVRAALRHPQLEGLPRLGRGVFCVAFDKGDTVLKLTCDPVSYEFAAGPLRPQGEHFPRLVADYGCVGETADELHDLLYLFEVEKLQPVRRDSLYHTKKAIGKMCKQISHTRDRYQYRERMTAKLAGVRTLEEMAADMDLPPSLRAAFGELATFTSNFDDAGLDFHRGNLMLRGDTIVLNDVLANRPMIEMLW